MHAERLLMLADYIEGKKQFKGRGIPVNQFSIELWMAPLSKFSKKFDIQSKPKRKKFTVVKKVSAVPDEIYKVLRPVELQTAGCAIGWAATLPEFNEQGLYLTEHSDKYYAPVYIENGMAYDDITSCKNFFDITLADLHNLFTDEGYKNLPTPAMIAKKIRKYVKLQNAIGEKL